MAVRLFIAVFEMPSPFAAVVLNVMRNLVGYNAKNQKFPIIAPIAANDGIICKRLVLCKPAHTSTEAPEIVPPIYLDGTIAPPATTRVVLRIYKHVPYGIAVVYGIAAEINLMLLLADFSQTLLGELNNEVVILHRNIRAAM